MMGECADCKWWGVDEPDPRPSSVRMCGLLTTVKGDVAEILLYGYPPGPGERIRTGQEFGCNQFEPRDAGGNDVA